MSEKSSRPDWTAMSRSEFDADAPNMLPVPVFSGRVVAVCDTYGTTALFGDDPNPAPVSAPRRPRPPAPGDVEGQGTLF